MGVLVLGRGSVGRSLAAAIERTGRPVRLLPGRSWREHAAELSVTPDARVFLAVPDPVVPGLAAGLADANMPTSSAFVHVSGSLTMDALSALAARGHATGAFHPLQAFPQPRPPSSFEGILVALDASTDRLYAELERLASDLGARPRRVPDDARALYHTAAVIAANYLVALAGVASAVLSGGTGWSREEALEALLPLMRGAVDNLASAGLPAALTGPVRRGDAATVSAHLQALSGAAGEAPERVYRMLGLAALALAREAGLDEDAAHRIEAALTA